MKQQQTVAIFTAIFIFIISFTYIGNMVLLGGAEKVSTAFENRKPASFPEFDKVKAKKAFAQFDSYLADRLFKREQVIEGINIFLADERWFFAQNFNDRAIFGSEGWVFLGNIYGNTMIKHTQVFDPTKIALHENKTLEHILGYKKLALENNAEFRVLIGPDKPSVYCRKLPIWLIQKPCSKVTEWTDYLIDGLKAEGIAVTYPQVSLLKASFNEQVYFKTDTHWNHSGAAVAYSVLMDDLKLSKFTDYQITHSVSHHRGDLASISGKGDKLQVIDSKSADLKMPQVEISWKEIGKEEKITSLMEVSHGELKGFCAEMSNLQAKNSQRVVVFCDSFMGALSPFINASFKHVLYISRHDDIEKIQASVKAFKPDLIIYETVERDL